MKKNLKSCLLMCAALVSGAASAQTVCYDWNGNPDETLFGPCTPPTGSGASKRTDNKLYMGLVWSFGQTANKTPDVLFGFRSTRVDASNKVKGGDLTVRLQSQKNYAVEGVRLSYLGGNRNALANVGVGYSYASGSSLMTAAIQASYIRVGTDYLLSNKNWAPYFEVNTLKRIQPTGSNLACSEGTLRTVDANFSGEDITNLPLGLLTPSQNLPGFGPYIPAGSQTCFAPAEP